MGKGQRGFYARASLPVGAYEKVVNCVRVRMLVRVWFRLQAFKPWVVGEEEWCVLTRSVPPT